MLKNWKYKEKSDSGLIDFISNELSIDRVIANLLVSRGVNTFDEAKAFFRPTLDNLHSPYLMKDMEKAVIRINDAIVNNQNILVYGDYDVDGTTAVAIVYSFLRKIYKNIQYYIPDRYTEGYGVSDLSIDFAVENNISLIIALDCGIKDNNEIDKANQHNIDFIVCDHHLPGDILPEAFAILDPKVPGCTYPFKDLSGCGIGFKLLQAYAEKYKISDIDVFDLIDLVAISIAADIVPVMGENRILAYYGLNKIHTNPSKGIEAILRICDFYASQEGDDIPKSEFLLKRELSLNDLAFIIGPRLNASGRINKGINTVELLLSEDINTATELASVIEKSNAERKNLDTLITNQALDIIKDNLQLENSSSTVLYNPDWHLGVLGIVAARLIENYFRPTIVLTRKNELIVGSARSIKKFDIYDALSECSDLLEHFGGHKYAAGLSLKPENLEGFILRFDKIVADRIDDSCLTPEIEIDDTIDISSITPKFFRILKQLAPFGIDNNFPVFVSKNVRDTGYASPIGKSHLKLNIHQTDSSRDFMGAIAFNQAEHYEYIKTGKPFDICYTIEENSWNGKTTIQLNIKDIKY